MTLTIHESPRLNSPAKPGSTPESSESSSIQKPRSNPVCLEVSATIRSLPGEKAEASSESSKPNREEVKTVIVFDKGAVLRVAGNFPPGQTIIVSNSQGRSVVCRVASARNLPTVKGYIEVEFVEPVDDFWGIHQSSGQMNVSNSPKPILAKPRVVPSVPAPGEAAPPCAAPIATQINAPSGDAQSLEDSVRVGRMSPLPITHGRALTPSPRPDALQNDESAQDLVETARPVSPAGVTAPAADPPQFPTTWKNPSVPVRKLPPPSDFLGKGALSSTGPPSMSSSNGSRGRIVLIFAGAVVVLAGVGAGFFFRSRGNVALPKASVSAVTQSSTPSLPTAANASEPAKNAQSAVDQKSPSYPAVSPVSYVSTDSAGAASSVSQTTRRPANNADAKQSERSDSGRRPILDLKMSAPTAASRNSGKLTDGSASGIMDAASVGAVSGTPAAAALSPIGRRESQPAPPPSVANSPGSPVKIVHEPKLILSTRPIYPEIAKRSNIQGTVVVLAELDANGNVVGTKAVSGPIILCHAAVDAVRHWKYEPAVIDGKAGAAQVSISIDFSLKR